VTIKKGRVLDDRFFSFLRGSFYQQAVKSFVEITPWIMRGLVAGLILSARRVIPPFKVNTNSTALTYLAEVGTGSERMALAISRPNFSTTRLWAATRAW
jgi:hypothetical protein